jgi:hypothetical protein
LLEIRVPSDSHEGKVNEDDLGSGRMNVLIDTCRTEDLTEIHVACRSRSLPVRASK